LVYLILRLSFAESESFSSARPARATPQRALRPGKGSRPFTARDSQVFLAWSINNDRNALPATRATSGERALLLLPMARAVYERVPSAPIRALSPFAVTVTDSRSQSRAVIMIIRVSIGVTSHRRCPGFTEAPARARRRGLKLNLTLRAAWRGAQIEAGRPLYSRRYRGRSIPQLR
jgi:hypothetical protein